MRLAKQLRFRSNRFPGFLAFLLAGALALLGCGNPAPVLLVTVSALQPEVTSLQITAKLNGLPDKEMGHRVQSGLQQFTLRLPAGSRGRLELNIDGLPADGCAVAQGAALVQIDDDREYPVALALTPQTESCLVRVDIVGPGTGSVSALPDKKLTCTATGCTGRFPLGAQVTLRANPDPSWYFSNWVGACSGRDACSLTVTGRVTTVKANMVVPPICSGGSWCFDNPTPTGATLYRIWGLQTAQGTELWAVGGGVILRRGGDGVWKQISNQLATGYTGVWGLASDDVWIVGSGTLYHWDGNVLNALVLPAGIGALNDVWGLAQNDVWAVGAAGAIAHWDGANWNSIQSGQPYNLSRLWGTSPSDLYAVGSGGTVLHSSGGPWSLVPNTPGGVNLTAVWASGDEAWAVGEKGTAVHLVRGVVDPNALSIAAAAGLTLSAVWGSGSSDVWATARDGTRVTSFFHWNGKWSVAPADPAAKNNWIFSLWGRSANDLWAAGSGGTVLHWNGARWSIEAGAPQGGLLSIWGSGPNDVWAVGHSELDNSGLLMHWDGIGWRRVPGDSGVWLYGVWGSGPNDVWAVGDGIWHWDGGPQWRRSPQMPSPALQAVWGSGSQDVWAVGEAGTILHNTGGAWISVQKDLTNKRLRSLWGSGATDIWAVGDEGTILRLQGSLWSVWRGTPRAAQRKNLYGVTGSGSQDVWAVGGDMPQGLQDERSLFGRTMLRWNGKEWLPVFVGTQNILLGVWSSGPNDVWAVGGGGGMVRGYANVTNPSLNVSSLLWAVWGAGPNDVWAVGNNDTILRFRP